MSLSFDLMGVKESVAIAAFSFIFARENYIPFNEERSGDNEIIYIRRN